MLMWHTTETGASVLLYDYDMVGPYLDETFAPMPRNIAAQAPALVEVLNATTYPDWDRVAADQLGWEGFSVSHWAQADSVEPHTTLIDYTATEKGSRLPALAELLKVAPENLSHQPDPNSPVAYRVVIGMDFEPCHPPSRGHWPAPAATPTPASEATSTP
jgi:hypothetical protein